jgi:hypothetical protein
MNLGGRYHLELTADSFNLFNRDSQRLQIDDEGYYNSAGQFIKVHTIRGGELTIRLIISNLQA